MSSIPAWFAHSSLNWAENQLRHCLTSPNSIAVIETSSFPPFFPPLLPLTPLSPSAEPPLNEAPTYRPLTNASLYTLVHHLTLALTSLSFTPGLILAYYGPTSTSSLALCLACTALGGIWTSAAADFGPQGVIERFAQFGEKLWGVVGVRAVRYNGKRLEQRGKMREVVEGLKKGRGGVRVWEVDYLGEGEEGEGVQEGWGTWEGLVQLGREEEERLRREEGGKEGEGRIRFWREGGFDHPLWVLFSSGLVRSFLV